MSSHEVLHEVLAFAQAPVYASLRGDPVPAFGWEPFTHPHIALKKQITKIDANSGRFHFADGSYVDDVDHVIFGTGYQFSMPFLPEVQKRIKNAHRRLPGVYEHVFDIEDPTLVFVGMVSKFLYVLYQPLPTVRAQLTLTSERRWLHVSSIRMAGRGGSATPSWAGKAEGLASASRAARMGAQEGSGTRRRQKLLLDCPRLRRVLRVLTGGGG